MFTSFIHKNQANLISYLRQQTGRAQQSFFMQQTNILCCLLVLLLATQASEVSYANIKAFWESTYDLDGDGKASVQDFVHYFRFIEPEHDVEEEHARPIFEFFDSDSDGNVTLQELIRIAKIKVSFKTGHKQLHLGLTGEEGQMQVMWVSNPEHYEKPVVEYGRIPGMLNSKAQGTYHTYNVGRVGGFHGRIYRAVMKDLVPFKTYYYRVGDLQTGTFSKVKYFSAPPLRAQTLEELNIAIFGDMGTFAPFGHFVMDRIARDHFIKPFQLVLLTGDIAYAGMNSQERGESAPIWDLFGQLSEKFASYVAFMPGVGNHESYYNYTAYTNRYMLPRKLPNQTNLFFSFDYGQLHFVHFSSEHPYSPGSEQYAFLEEDLGQARNNPNVQWIVLADHRAFYSSNLNQYSNVTQLCIHLEELVNKYRVDVVQVGHLHNYERTWPTYKGKALKEGANHTHYVDPKAPVYVVQGTAGALIREHFLKPVPEWSAVRQQKYGYGRMLIKGNSLKYQFISIPSGKISDEWTIIKTARGSTPDQLISQ